MVNTNFHYMIPSSGNFVGIEINKEVFQKDFDITLRPQMRITLSNSLKLCLVGGITINNPKQRLSVFSRLIYEPDSRRKSKKLVKP